MPSTTETTQTETSSTTVPATVSTSTDRVLGLVKWFQGGFGFVTNFETKEDVFVHHSSVTTTVECWKMLYPGEYVDFSVGTMDDGKSQAVNVTGVRGGPLRCETLSLLRQEREEYNRDNQSTEQDGHSTRNTSGRSRGDRGGRGGRGGRSRGDR
jgi:cold shock CspA family protein